MDKELYDKMFEKVIDLYMYERRPRTDGQSVAFGKFLDEQYSVAFEKEKSTHDSKYSEQMEELTICMLANVGEVQYLLTKHTVRNYFEKEGLDYDEQMNKCKQLMEEHYDETVKIIEKYEKLMLKQ